MNHTNTSIYYLLYTSDSFFNFTMWEKWSGQNRTNRTGSYKPASIILPIKLPGYSKGWHNIILIIKTSLLFSQYKKLILDVSMHKPEHP